MQVEQLGSGDPDYAVVVCIHGDEICGKVAMDRLRSEVTFQKPIKHILANERAYKAERQYMDTNLNRAFPGDRSSDSYEDRVAVELLAELRDLTVIDFHSGTTYPETFAVVQRPNSINRQLVAASGIPRAVTLEDINRSLIDHVDGIAVECGYRGSDEAIENAYAILRNFLTAVGIIDGTSTCSEPSFYITFDTVQIEGDEFLAENFRQISPGEEYIRRDGEFITADQQFVPVFMETTDAGYVKGYKARCERRQEVEG